ncbi:MAG: hypothetical protein KDA21_12305, partial [Phycisphaerales bacterium]|nr:hypothetical protein [Phycisphaerales bacterium]
MIGTAMMLATVMTGAVEYSVIDVGSLAGGDNALPPGTVAADIGPAGTVVGSSVLSGVDADFRAYTWTAGSMMELIHLGMHGQSQAFAVNGFGDVAGVSFQLGDLLPVGMAWNAAGIPTVLGEIVPQDISDDGLIVGAAPTDFTGLHYRAAQWDGGVITMLPDLGGLDSVAREVGADGRIVGGATPGGADGHHAVLWQDGMIIDLGTPGGATSQAYAISPSGRIVGHGRTAGGQVRAFMADVDSAGAVQTFTTLSAIDNTFAYARGINAAHDIVGTSDSRAVRWDAAGTLVDLNDLIPPGSGWVLTHALAINDAGQIVGKGLHLGKPRAFLLSPADVCPGDANGDLQVNFEDLNLVLDHWGNPGG